MQTLQALLIAKTAFWAVNGFYWAMGVYFLLDYGTYRGALVASIIVWGVGCTELYIYFKNARLTEIFLRGPYGASAFVGATWGCAETF